MKYLDIERICKSHIGSKEYLFRGVRGKNKNKWKYWKILKYDIILYRKGMYCSVIHTASSFCTRRRAICSIHDSLLNGHSKRGFLLLIWIWRWAHRFSPVIFYWVVIRKSKCKIAKVKIYKNFRPIYKWSQCMKLQITRFWCTYNI